MVQTKTNTMAEVVRPERVLDALDRVHDTVGGLVASTDTARLGDPTPCADWDVRTLINHLVEINKRYMAMIEGTEPPAAGEDVLRDDPAGAYREAARTLRDAVREPGAIDELYPSPWGEISGAVIVQHAINESIAHGWDLAKATGRPTDIVPDLATESLKVWRAWFDGDVGRMDDFFDAERPAPADASPADRVAAYLGREV
jgi:uncharacterized protein (TIGR03086 family)